MGSGTEAGGQRAADRGDLVEGLWWYRTAGGCFVLVPQDSQGGGGTGALAGLTSVLTAVVRVGVQGQDRQRHSNVHQEQAGQLVLLLYGGVVCRRSGVESGGG